MQKNAHVGSVISNYLSKPPFGALLITGDWGSGKTHLVKSDPALQANQAVYVSVNGAGSLDEIRKRIIYSAFPLLGNPTFRTLGSLASSALGMLQFNLNLNADDLASLESVGTIVIDDVERINLNAREALGYFNGLCEHEAKHVILVADEEQLGKLDGFDDVREKTIGKSIRVYADFEGGIQSLSGDIAEDYLAYLESRQASIEHLFESLQSSNLRILKQIAYEFEDIFSHIAALEDIDRSTLDEIFDQFTIFSLAWKTKLIVRSDFQDRLRYSFGGYLNSEKEDEKSNLQKLSEFASNELIFGGPIDGDFLTTKVCDGLSHFDDFDRGLDDIRARLNPTQHPEWRILWHYFDHEESLIRASYRKLRERFAKREYTDSGVILHIFGIMVEMQRAGLDRRRSGTIISEGKSYIDDLYRRKALPSLSDDVRGSWRYGSAHGLGFMNASSEEFRALLNYYQVKSAKVREEALLTNLLDIVDDLEENGDLFEAIVSDSFSEMSVIRHPLLARVGQKKFARAVLSCSGSTQFKIIRALGQRYTNYPNLIAGEALWLKGVVHHLRKGVESLPAPAPYRMGKIIELTLQKTIEGVDDAAPSTAESQSPPP